MRIPADHLLGGRGDGFVVAQTRLGGGRIHHAMRTVGLVRQALEQMCERVLSRSTQGELLARKQLVQAMIADSWIELEQFRLLVLRTAWKIDRYNDYQKVRGDISAVKVGDAEGAPRRRRRGPLQLHGSLGVSHEMPFASMVLESFHMGLADGATEVHKVTLAREVLKGSRRHRRPVPDAAPAAPARGRRAPVRRRARRRRVVTMHVGLSVYDIAPGELVELAQAAETAGFRTLWLGEHVVLPVDYRAEHPTTALADQRVAHRAEIIDPATQLLDPLIALGRRRRGRPTASSWRPGSTSCRCATRWRSPG